MTWIKNGLLFRPEDVSGFHTSHTTAPCVLALEDRVRAFYSGRDDRGRSFISWVDLKPSPRGLALCAQAGRSVLEAGEPGLFDDSGAMASWAVEHEGGVRMYYTGWNTGSEVPFRLSVGLALGDGRGALRRLSPGPILDRNTVDPILMASPCVLRHKDGWKMWYVSGVAWREFEGTMRHYYHIRYATSEDGVSWERDGHVCLDFLNEKEYALSRPCVLLDGDTYHMWFSYRGSDSSALYRIGHAVSGDGLHWTRDEGQGGLEPGDEPWESDMVCYGCVFDFRGTRWMLYNGNGYGGTGVGCAKWEEDQELAG